MQGPSAGHVHVRGILELVMGLPDTLKEVEEEEEKCYNLRPANKTDHLCQSWQ